LRLLGLSGCGKPSTIRMVAALEAVSDGMILADGNRIDHLSPQARECAIMFENSLPASHGLREHCDAAPGAQVAGSGDRAAGHGEDPDSAHRAADETPAKPTFRLQAGRTT
jgi:ABC-type uncharacterized transport system YnjBCD ATPase subunit